MKNSFQKQRFILSMKIASLNNKVFSLCSNLLILSFYFTTTLFFVLFSHEIYQLLSYYQIILYFLFILLLFALQFFHHHCFQVRISNVPILPLTLHLSTNYLNSIFQFLLLQFQELHLLFFLNPCFTVKFVLFLSLETNFLSIN